MRRERLVTGLAVAVLLSVGLAVYWPLFSFTFFGEDPYDIGQVNDLTFSQLWLTPVSNAYFRPLTLVLTKLLQNKAPFSPAPYYVLSVGARLSAAVLLLGAAHHWFGSRLLAFCAALLFVLYSPSFEALARPSSLHSILIPLSIAALWLYSAGRETGRWLLMSGSLWLAVVSFLLHENSLVLPVLVVMLELYLWQQRRVERFGWPALLFLGPALVFGLIWLSIPKPGLPIDAGVRPLNLVYMSQGLSFPLARLVTLGGGWGLGEAWQAIVALAGSLVVLAIGVSPKRRPMLALGLGWWAAMSCPAGLALSFEYLQLGGRVFYFPAFAASLAWASLIADSSRLRQIVGALAVLLIAAQNWHTVTQQVALYRAGSDLMKEIVAVGVEAERPLFINVPDRFQYRQPLYPLGHWGMLLAPVSQQLDEFVWLSTGRQLQSESLSDFGLRAEMLDASPYQVNTRGVDAHASELMYEKILWADEVWWTDYVPDGSLRLRAVGDVLTSPAPVRVVGRFGEAVALLESQGYLNPDGISLRLLWHSLSSLRPTDTIFVHLYDRDGLLIGQADGDSLYGLLPPSAWRPGHFIADNRWLVTEGPLPPGRYRITVGVYDRATGERYPAFDASGHSATEAEIEVGWIDVP